MSELVDELRVELETMASDIVPLLTYETGKTLGMLRDRLMENGFSRPETIKLLEAMLASDEPFIKVGK